jgi:uncharacterized protein
MLVYLIFMVPAVLVALIAQVWLRNSYAKMSRVRARMSGYQAARYMLDSAGLTNIDIEQVPGELSDHYDPSRKVVRLSSNVFNGHSMAAVGIACHEVGHALQDARRYAPLVLRNMAVPIASIGSKISELAFFIGVGALFAGLPFGKYAVLLGAAGFTAVVLFQLINLPVEFDASARAKRQLVAQGMITAEELPMVSSVLNAAAMTYVAATLQAIMTLLYYAFILMQGSQQRHS